MTIAVVLKVNDGVVLAADSAATLTNGDGSVRHVFNNANKIINLVKGLPVGIVSWGAGGIGNAGLETLVKDLRRRFMGMDPAHQDWKVDKDNYEVATIADRVRTYLFDGLYVPVYQGNTNWPEFGCIVAGYSHGESMSDMFEISIRADGTCPMPTAACDKNHSPYVVMGGQSEGILRLLNGFDPMLPALLHGQLGTDPAQFNGAMQAVAISLVRPVIEAPMPIQDAIELAEFLVDLSIKYTHFIPGASTVGGPIEVAAITKHEGFKWIRRKHYYDRSLNPEEVHDARPDLR